MADEFSAVNDWENSAATLPEATVTMTKVDVNDVDNNKQQIVQEPVPADEDTVDEPTEELKIEQPSPESTTPLHEMFEGVTLIDQSQPELTQEPGANPPILNTEPFTEVLVDDKKNTTEWKTSVNQDDGVKKVEGEDGELHIYLLVGDRFCGGLIGRGGKVIDQIRHETKASICLQDRRVKFHNHQAKRALKIRGNVTQVQNAIISTAQRLLEVKAANVAYKNNAEVQTVKNPTLEITFLSPMGVVNEDFRVHSQIVVEAHDSFELIELWGNENTFSNLVAKLLRESTLGTTQIEEARMITAFTRRRQNSEGDYDGRRNYNNHGGYNDNNNRRGSYNNYYRNNDNDGYRNNNNHSNHNNGGSNGNYRSQNGYSNSDNYHQRNNYDHDNTYYPNNNNGGYRNRRRYTTNNNNNNQNNYSNNGRNDNYSNNNHRNHSNERNNQSNNNEHNNNNSNNDNNVHQNNHQNNNAPNSNSGYGSQTTSNPENNPGNALYSNQQESDIWKKKDHWESANNKSSNQYFNAFNNSYNGGSLSNMPKDVIWEDV